MRNFQKITMVFLVILFMPVMAKGEGNLHVGSLEIHPYVSLKETYSDNIYYTSADTESDYITTILPGIKLIYPFREHEFDFEYYATVYRYNEFTEEDTTDHNADGLLNFKLGSLVELKFSDNYIKGHEPRSSSSTGFIEKYTTNSASGSITYHLADISKLQMDYTRTMWNFKTSDFRDRDEDLISAYIYYRVLPKTSAFIEYDYKNVAYDLSASNLDNTVNSGLVGLTWEITEKSKGTVKGGYSFKTYDASSMEDFDTWVASVEFDHEFTDYTAMKLIGKREVNETNLSGARYYVTTGAYTEFSHKFTQKLTAIVRGSYGQDEFSDIVLPDTQIREDKTSSAGAGLKYLIQEWMDIALDYNFKKRDSNIDANDYDENSYSIAINIAF